MVMIILEFSFSSSPLFFLLRNATADTTNCPGYFIFSLAAAGDLGGSSAKNEEEVVGGFSLQQPG